MLFSEFRFNNSLYLSLLGIVLIAINIFLDLDLFEHFVEFVHQHEEYDIDEITLFVIPLIIGLIIDLLNEKSRKEQVIERERLKVRKATMTTVHDINNNFLNALLYHVSEAKENNQIDEKAFEEIDQLIFETADKLKQLGDINHTQEIDIAAGIKGIDYKKGNPSS